MPTDANGVYSLPDGYLAETGETILASQHNPPLEDLAASMTLRFMRSGVAPMTGPVKAVDGTVSAPGYTFSTAPSSGFYKTADGIGVSVGGAMVAEFISGGLRTGGKFVGELFGWTGSAAPPLCVLPYGQTLDRTTYAALWTFAQVEIGLGSTLYNNGNGSTTFGVPDMRGRVQATKDNMGGSTAGRLTATYFGAVTGATGLVLGGVGGLESNIIAQANLPNVILATSTTVTGRVNNTLTSPGSASAIDLLQLSGGGGTVSQAFPGTTSALGSGTAHANVQPTIIINCALFAGA